MLDKVASVLSVCISYARARQANGDEFLNEFVSPPILERDVACIVCGHHPELIRGGGHRFVAVLTWRDKGDIGRPGRGVSKVEQVGLVAVTRRSNWRVCLALGERGDLEHDWHGDGIDTQALGKNFKSVAEDLKRRPMEYQPGLLGHST
jgi:hypothetical protein